jgi:ribonuclease BN (tRNA processing enzyme)
VFSGDTTANDDLIALAWGADILVHQVADLGWLETRRAGQGFRGTTTAGRDGLRRALPRATSRA